MATSSSTDLPPAYSRHKRVAHCDCSCHSCVALDCHCFDLCICECRTLLNHASSFAPQRSQDSAEDVMSACGNCSSRLPNPSAIRCLACGYNFRYKASDWMKVVDKVGGGLKTVFAPKRVTGFLREHKRRKVEERMREKGYIWIVRH